MGAELGALEGATFSSGGALVGVTNDERAFEAERLAQARMQASFDSFVAAAQGATPRGITIVEEAIDRAIAEIDRELVEMDPDLFGVEGFIPLAAFGAADRTPELAVHHTRAHSVMTATLVGVRGDLEHFKTACELARRDIRNVEDSFVDDLTRLQIAVAALGDGLTSYGSEAYANAMETASEIDIEDTETAPVPVADTPVPDTPASDTPPTDLPATVEA